MDIDPDGVARYHQFAENHRQQCREKRLREAEWHRELDELDELAKCPRRNRDDEGFHRDRDTSAAQSEGVHKTNGANAAASCFRPR